MAPHSYAWCRTRTQDWKKTRFLGFQVSTKSDTKLRPLSTIKSKDKSTEQRFGHVNAMRGVGVRCHASPCMGMRCQASFSETTWRYTNRVSVDSMVCMFSTNDYSHLLNQHIWISWTLCNLCIIFASYLLLLLLSRPHFPVWNRQSFFSVSWSLWNHLHQPQSEVT